MGCETRANGRFAWEPPAVSHGPAGHISYPEDKFPAFPRPHGWPAPLRARRLVFAICKWSNDLNVPGWCLGSGAMWLAYYVHHLDPILFQFTDQIAVRWYGLAYLAGFVAAFYVLKWLARKGYGSLRPEQVADYVFYAALFGVLVGGRLGYILFYHPEMITNDPIGIVRTWDGGMASHGGILGVLIVTFIYARLRHISWTGIGDNLVTAAPLGLMFGRLANFINGELYGRPTTVPWAMQFPLELLDHPAEAAQAIDRCAAINPAWSNVKDIIVAARHSPQVREILSQILTPRHPSQLYEAGLEGLLLFILLLTIRLWFRKPNGLTTGAFFILYPIMRIIGECFREPDAPLTGPFSRGQFLSFFMFAIGFAFLYYAWRQWKAEVTSNPGFEITKGRDSQTVKRRDG